MDLICMLIFLLYCQLILYFRSVTGIIDVRWPTVTIALWWIVS